MTSVHFRNPETRLSAALRLTAAAVRGDSVTLRELLQLVGEQGLLVFCAILAAPFLLPVSVPLMSTALGLPMLLIGSAVMFNTMVWLPDRMLDHAMPSESVRQVLERIAVWAEKFEHLVRPRLQVLTGGAAVNVMNGGMIVLAVLLLLAPLPLVPFTNTVPGIAIMLLCLGMAERDGAVIILGYLMTLVSLAYIGTLLALVIYAGMNAGQVLDHLRALIGW